MRDEALHFAACTRPEPRPLRTERIWQLLMQAWQWLAARRRATAEMRQLRIVETVQLGEKRFVTLLDAGGRRLLIGGAPGQLTLLARLDEDPRQPGADTGEPV